MARIAGVNIPTAKRVPIALTYITGIGPHTAQTICEALKIDTARRASGESSGWIVVPSTKRRFPARNSACSSRPKAGRWCLASVCLLR